MLSHYLYVGLGGALGAVARFGAASIMPAFIHNMPFPIMAVNVTGCFIIGVLSEFMALFWSPSDEMRYFLIPGFLGGFTTFSSFALEFGYLIEKNNHISAVAYVVLSVALSLLFFILGMKLVRTI